MEQHDWHCYLAIGDIFYENNNAPAPVVYCDAEETENGIYFRYRTGSESVLFTPGKRLMVSYDELRENDVVYMERCTNTEIEGIRIYHAAGMGIVGQCCENLHMNRYAVDPGDDGLYATTADAILLTNFFGHVCIENCCIDRPVDDALSIHGFYTHVDTITDRCKVVVRMMHPSQAGTNPYYPGDTLVVCDGETMCYRGTITVKKSYIRDDPALIYLETEESLVGLLQQGDILENPGRTPTVEIKNNIFRNFPAIRLCSAQKMVFANNLVENCSALLVNDLIKYWSVSGCVREMYLQNNTFQNMETGIHIFSERPAESDVRHRNITIAGNVFRNCRTGIKAVSADKLMISENTFQDVKDPIDLRQCEDVCCQDNHGAASE